MEVPFVDLHAQYLAIRPQIDSAIQKVIEKTAFIGGEFVTEFERAFASDYGVKHCIPVANGTDAIYIALRMLGIGTGDEVITTAHSWISTSEAVSQTGATPVFVDVDSYYGIDADQIESVITARTKAIIPVHLYGQPSDMTRIMAIARAHGLLVLEDCAQAHYATWQGQRVGTFGDVATFSFYPGKNLGAYGDAGAIVTGDSALAERMRMFANHGALKKHSHRIEGINSRLDGLQAAILSAKLPFIAEWTEKRRRAAALYDRLLADANGLSIPARRPGADHVFHLYVVQVDKREEVQQFLARRGVQTAVHYPVALPAMEAYSRLAPNLVAFPNAIRNQDRILSLPMFAELTPQQIEHVAAALIAATAELCTPSEAALST
jgi:dTDP-4-amino-4,6-dideoxygalactose transaminase